MNDLLKNILEILEVKGPLRAKKIALILDPTRKKITHTQVSAVLHQELKLNLVGLSQNKDFFWEYEKKATTLITLEVVPLV